MKTDVDKIVSLVNKMNVCISKMKINANKNSSLM